MTVRWSAVRDVPDRPHLMAWFWLTLGSNVDLDDAIRRQKYQGAYLRAHTFAVASRSDMQVAHEAPTLRNQNGSRRNCLERRCVSIEEGVHLGIVNAWEVAGRQWRKDVRVQAGARPCVVGPAR